MQAGEERTHRAVGRTYFASEARSEQRIRDALHQLSTAGDIRTARRHPAAGIFYQRTDDEIGTDVAWLARFDELAITIIDYDQRAWGGFFHVTSEFRDLCDRQRRARRVPG